MATAPETPPLESAYRLRLLERRDREVVCAFLRRRAPENLFLLDLVDRVGRRANAGDVESVVLGIWQGDRFAGAASLRPTVALDIELAGTPFDLAAEAVARLSSGLLRCEPDQAERLWQRLERAGRRAQIDRREWTLRCTPVLMPHVPPPAPASAAAGGVAVREAHLADLEALVEAARASLREEGRPDPFVGDPHGFRRWVRNRLPRALVAEHGGRVAFVGYSDVQLPEGWLLQGVYTWPSFRRRGLARAGVAALCGRAFAAGAEHVQLSVVDGNSAAHRLYDSLGFERLGELRTLLFEASGR